MVKARMVKARMVKAGKDCGKHTGKYILTK